MIWLFLDSLSQMNSLTEMATTTEKPNTSITWGAQANGH